MTVSFLVAICLLLLVACQTSSQVIETLKGKVRGKQEQFLGQSVHVFHGIPYAKPPIGVLRFKHPQEAESWGTKVKDASKRKPSCIQPIEIYASVSYDPLRIPTGNFSEDCLHVSVWKPGDASRGSNLAVMVWIYGGGFSSGSTNIQLYDGLILAAKYNVIVVSMNYRVGPLGFAYLSPGTIPGNMGMLDQVLALRWVNENIKNFGGDEKRITIFGESAGGASVVYHILSQLPRDLFTAAIVQSGSPFHKVGMKLYQMDHEGKENIQLMGRVLHCPESSDMGLYKCLLKESSDNISMAMMHLLGKGVNFYPVIDRYFLPDDPLTLIEKGQLKNSPLLVGTTKNEITLTFPQFMRNESKINNDLFELMLSKYASLAPISNKFKALSMFYRSLKESPTDNVEVLDEIGTDLNFKCPARLFGSQYSLQNDVYLYVLDYRISTLKLPWWTGVPHNYDLDLVFGLPLDTSMGFSKTDREVSEDVMTYWTNFAKSGNPNTPISPRVAWQPFKMDNDTFLTLNSRENLTNTRDFRQHECAFITKILPQISDSEITLRTTPTAPCVYTGSGTRSQFDFIFTVTTFVTLVLQIEYSFL